MRDLHHGIAHRVEGLALLAVDLARLAEVQAAGQLADDQQVGAFRDLGLERSRAFQARPDARRPQIGVDAKALPQREQSALGPFLRRQVIEGRIADRAHQRRRRGPAVGERLWRQCGFTGAQRRAAHQVGRGGDRVTKPRRDGAKDIDRRRDHFGPDAVTWNEGDIKNHVRSGL